MGRRSFSMGRKALAVALDGLIERLRLDTVELSKMLIEHYLVSANQQNALRDRLCERLRCTSAQPAFPGHDASLTG